MRYDTPIYFQKLTPGEYDPATGNYGEDTISEDMKFASGYLTAGGQGIKDTIQTITDAGFTYEIESA